MNKTILLFGFAILIVACTSKTEVKTAETKTVDKDSIRTIIESMEARYAKGLETRSIDDIMAYYSSDIKSFEAGSEPIMGAEAMKKMTTEMFAKMPKRMKIKMESTDMIISNDGGVVSETGGYRATDSLGNEFASGHFLATFEIKDGQYKCTREMVASNKKPEHKEEKK